MEKYEILKNLVGFDTIKDKENGIIISYIENLLKNKGFRTDYKGKYLIMSIGEDFKLGFLGHTDTVEYIEGWDSDPFEVVRKDGKLYGLGVCDMKGGIAAFLDAILDTDFTKLRYGMKLYFTYDEEIGFGGIYDIVSKNEKFPEFMIFGEPTDNEILVGSKGLLEFILKFNGIKAHSSNPEKGKSANLSAVKFLADLTDFYEINIKSFKENSYEVPYTTMNIGVIKGGSANNSLSAFCDVTLDFRIANKEHINKIKDKIEELAQKYDCDFKVFECIEPFINEVMGSKKTSNFITEASAIKDENVKKIILGLGPVTAHEINEHITEASYDKLVLQYKEIIEEKCT